MTPTDEVTASTAAGTDNYSPESALPTSAPAPAPAPASSFPHADDDEETISLTLTHHGTPHTFVFAASATLDELSDAISADLSIPPSNQKLLVTPKPGLLKPPFKDGSQPLSSIAGRKIVLMGSTTAEISQLNAHITQAARQRGQRRGPVKPAVPARTRDPRRAMEDATYTFQTLRPLDYLPNAGRSLAFLERLRDDPGIRAAMRAHRFRVGLLTEMDPAMHTTHESRTMGLNRNRGEVIELRLRTDAYDGYRDYKTIRRTLCHELAHNVWGDHDRNFWDLCKQIEREVDRGDWRSGGRSVGNDVYYEPMGDIADGTSEPADHGGWTGGSFVLGTGGAVSNGSSGPTSASSSSSLPSAPPEGLGRREMMAKAAEERMKSSTTRRSGTRGGAGTGAGGEAGTSDGSEDQGMQS